VQWTPDQEVSSSVHGHRVVFLGRHLIMDAETGSSKFNVGCNNVMDWHPEEGVHSEILLDDSCNRSRK